MQTPKHVSAGGGHFQKDFESLIYILECHFE